MTLDKLAPGAFVFLWSTGFLGAKLTMSHSEPFIFLAIRFLLAATLLAAIFWLTRPRGTAIELPVWHAMIVGILVHGIYLGGVFAAVAQGVNAGISAVIVGAQPILTAALALVLLKESISKPQWLGFLLGFIGLTLIVSRQFTQNPGSSLALGLCFIALLGITLGTLYQKRYCQNMNLWAGSAVQYIAAAGFASAGSWMLAEPLPQNWPVELIFGMMWLVLVLSVGAVSLLWILLRRGAAAKVASLFYLVPVVTAILSYLLFDERMTYLSIFGMALTVIGVALVSRTHQP